MNVDHVRHINHGTGINTKDSMNTKRMRPCSEKKKKAIIRISSPSASQVPGNQCRFGMNCKHLQRKGERDIVT